MDWPEIESRIRAGENDTPELKRWEAFPRGVGEAVCAFGNTEGGVVILGVADDGTIAGVPEEPESAQERLTTFLQSGLSSPVRAKLGRHRVAAGWVHWVEVRRTRGPDPLRFRGRVLVRRGRSSVEPSPSELQDLYNTFGFALTEEQVVPGTSPADIEPEAFKDFLQRQGLELTEEPQPGFQEDLLNRGVLAREDGSYLATLYGLLCFGRDPQGCPPTSNAWIDCVAYAGGDRADAVILAGKARGRVDEQVERALGWIQALGVQEVYGRLERKDLPIVPIRALREALVNAVAHRDYAILGSKVLFEVFRDRVVITSPGELPNNLREASALAGGHPRSRNELVANFLLVKGLMEKRGRGFPIIRREMQAFNGTEPHLLNQRDERYVRLTLWRGSSPGRN
ncbi:MAG: putative DNA binding domain-containing protein [Planctomycetes bacterium]|nr:putative DNA binding domain-containing protein [Planctomycetota bacterium]